MRIFVKRAGGFAGVTEEVASVDTASLNEAAARRVEQMVRDARFFEMPGDVRGTIGADMFQHEITVTDGDRRHTVVFDDDTLEGAPLRALAAVLSELKGSSGTRSR